MEKQLAGKVAFVTGSGRGLGRTITEALAQRGADVVIHGSSDATPARYGEASDLASVATAIASRGIRTTTVTGDIANEEAVRRMVQKVEADLGPISILLNCAGG